MLWIQFLMAKYMSTRQSDIGALALDIFQRFLQTPHNGKRVRLYAFCSLLLSTKCYNINYSLDTWEQTFSPHSREDVVAAEREVATALEYRLYRLPSPKL